jgi:hypothetical protein
VPCRCPGLRARVCPRCCHRGGDLASASAHGRGARIGEILSSGRTNWREVLRCELSTAGSSPRPTAGGDNSTSDSDQALKHRVLLHGSAKARPRLKPGLYSCITSSDQTLKKILVRVPTSHAAPRALCVVSRGHAYASLPLETGLLRSTTSPALHELESLLLAAAASEWPLPLNLTNS